MNSIISLIWSWCRKIPHHFKDCAAFRSSGNFSRSHSCHRTNCGRNRSAFVYLRYGGRGGGQSFCILMSGEKLSRESRKRLQAMCQTTDGFRLAELDMQLRGAGDINGTQQSGMGFDLKIANPTLDANLLQTAREAAIAILSRDPQLEHPENRGLRTLRARHAGGRKFDFSMIS